MRHDRLRWHSLMILRTLLELLLRESWRDLNLQSRDYSENDPTSIRVSETRWPLPSSVYVSFIKNVPYILYWINMPHHILSIYFFPPRPIFHMSFFPHSSSQHIIAHTLRDAKGYMKWFITCNIIMLQGHQRTTPQPITLNWLSRLKSGNYWPTTANRFLLALTPFCSKA